MADRRREHIAYRVTVAARPKRWSRRKSTLVEPTNDERGRAEAWTEGFVGRVESVIVVVTPAVQYDAALRRCRRWRHRRHPSPRLGEEGAHRFRCPPSAWRS